MSGPRVRVQAGLILLFCLLLACGTSTGPAGESPPGASTPRLILTPPSFEGVAARTVPHREALVFKGSADAYTPLFTVGPGPWRIAWSVETQAPQFLLFAAFVFPVGQPGNPVTAFESTGDLEGVVEVESGPGEYYLRVSTANVQNWKLEISQ